MQNIIEALYNGELLPLEQIVVNDTTYQDYIKNQTEALDVLTTTLTIEEKAMLELYLNKRNETEAYLHTRLFCYGFSIGIQILFESLTQKL